ncbi:hypothetical protein [Haloimpatiens massiliensis]|nr:hypothetical protein [Haloimpatiens massiliensis]
MGLIIDTILIPLLAISTISDYKKIKSNKELIETLNKTLEKID